MFLHGLTATVATPIGEVIVVANARGVVGVTFSSTEVIKENDETKGALAHLRVAQKELTRYFDGKETAFTFPLVPTGTPFQQDVWKALQKIPYGQTRTYGEIAAAITRPLSPRPVGQAVGANPWVVVVPCHRVVASSGLGGYSGGLEKKSFLLALEGA
jgi:O-6-methylguanine DNA methyltransferase